MALQPRPLRWLSGFGTRHPLPGAILQGAAFATIFLCVLSLPYIVSQSAAAGRLTLMMWPFVAAPFAAWCYVVNRWYHRHPEQNPFNLSRVNEASASYGEGTAQDVDGS